MKKSIIITCFILLFSSVLFTGCTNKTDDSSTNSSGIEISDNTDNNSSSTVDSTSASSDHTSDTQTFTIEELKKYDGQNGNPAYVAVNGIVYDVTNEKEWENGSHQGLTAGADLTDELSKSPHGDSVLADLTVVGTLE